jgi:hypothetical protein
VVVEEEVIMVLRLVDQLLAGLVEEDLTGTGLLVDLLELMDISAAMEMDQADQHLDLELTRVLVVVAPEVLEIMQALTDPIH